ncbi:MAG: heavy metal translocating P-type ATPase, partial [Zestosphaera sp.]
RDEKRDYFLAGSILSTGYIKVRATRVGRDTVISHIAESAREAQLYKPEFQRFADRIVGFLTWIVIALAFSTSLIWYFITGNLHLALMFAASVLAVTCPCPLGIAIPMVISIGVLRASRNGILVRRGDVFERMVSADTLIFDKTGTLTIGKPRVTDVFVVNGDEDSLMKYVCSVEGRSEHQLANAILEYCNGKGHGNINEPSNYEYFPGLGVIGEVDGHYIVIGNLELMKRLNIDLSEEVLELVNKIGERGGTPILASVNEVIAGIIGVRDELREEVYEIVEFFKKSGFRTGIASGDIEANVKRVEKVIGADFSKAGLRPEDKASLMKEMESRGSRIVFVGDGVNDAIAIGSAFLGIAVGKATDIAKNAGDVVLVSSSLTKLKQLFNLSLKVKKRALENLAWAFIYNGLLIPIAAGVLYKSHGIMLKPEWAALSMILSDITVVLNSLRLVVERT